MERIPVLSRTYDFILWLKKALAKFPRNERYSFGGRLENKALDLLDTLLRAAYSRNKETLLREANAQIEQLRFLLRLCLDCSLMTEKKYEYGSKCLLEIGRQVGGWMKSRGKTDEGV